MAGKNESVGKKKKKWPWIMGICILLAVIGGGYALYLTLAVKEETIK